MRGHQSRCRSKMKHDKVYHFQEYDLLSSMKAIIFIFIMALFTTVSLGQEKQKKQYRHLAFDWGYGDIMPTTEFVEGDNLKGVPLTRYQSYSLKMLWQNPGYTHWQQVFKAPYYGVGVSLNNFYNADEIGYPVSIYGVIGMPLKRWGKLAIHSEFQFGMAVGWKHYEAEDNAYNMAIGSPITVHVTGELNALYNLTKHTDIGIGTGFVHFSNGGMERPNRGVNILSTTAKLNYHFGGRPPVSDVKLKTSKPKKRSLLLMLGYGNHQLVEHELDTNYFAIGGISAIYLEQLSQAFRVGIGTDLNYWWGLNANPDGTIAPRDESNLTVGLVLQPEVIIDRLTLVGGVGIYARHRNYGDFTEWYQRLGARYDIYKNMSLGVNVRAINFMLAEFMEFNLAYRIDWVK